MHKEKLIFPVCIGLLLWITVASSSATCWWRGDSGVDKYWNNTNNWWNNVPTSSDTANINKGQGIHPEIDATCQGFLEAKCNTLYLPDWLDDDAEMSYLYMTGGILTVGDDFVMGRWGGVMDGQPAPFDKGFFNISGGNVTIGGDFSVALSGEGTVNMTGGTINVNGVLKIPNGGTIGGAGVGTGRINLHGGTITTNGISMNESGLIDINEGKLIVAGNVVSTVNNYINNGWIVANELSCEVIADYNSVTDRTTVIAVKAVGLIDNFESYTDNNDLRNIWKINSSDTNSSVFLGMELYHKGVKSMGFNYNNNSPHYSEVYRVFDSAEDWTHDGFKFLSLFFHGSVDNDAEQMYLILQDENDVNAIVLYNGNLNDLIQQEGEYWNIWNIRLQDFNSNGLDLTNIKKITFGFGGNGGSGIIYFDDIRLSASRIAADYDYTPASDFTGDAAVNFLDYTNLAYAWFSTPDQTNFSDLYDINSNNSIDIADLKIFAQDWLWPHEQVRITIDACDIKGDISSMLTGVNMSYYYDNDNIWADGKMAEYLRQVNAGILRYPGGVETSKFHWDKPYNHWNVDLWDPNIDPNDYPPTDVYMDVNNYIQQCRIIGAEPLIGINVQSGVRFNRLQDSIDEAVRWVQFCKNNDYNVTYWYLENEPYYNSNCDGITVEDYASYIKQFVPAMKAVDPNIKIIVNWENKLSVPSYWSDWEYLIEEAGQHIDIADVHWYWAWGYATWDMWLHENPMTVREWCGDCSDQKYYGPSYVDEIKGFYDKIKDVNGQSYDIKLAALEWNIAPVKDGRFSKFQHALMQAEILGQYIEGGLYMACIWPLTWGGDLYGDFRTVLDQEFHKPTPSFYVFELYSSALGSKLISSTADKSYVRTVSALSQDGKTLRVYLLNKLIGGQSVRACLDIDAFSPVSGEAIALVAPDLSSNSGKLKKLIIRSCSGLEKWEVVLPPYSLTMAVFSK